MAQTVDKSAKWTPSAKEPCEHATYQVFVFTDLGLIYSIDLQILQMSLLQLMFGCVESAMEAKQQQNKQTKNSNNKKPSMSPVWGDIQ